MKTVGEYIKQKRMSQGLSASEVARSAGVTGEHILYIEKGERKTPSFDVVMKILRALHVDLQEFLRETGYMPVNVPAPLKTMRLVPVISWVTASNWQGSASEDNLNPDEWTETDVQGKRVFALRVRGNCMEPEFVEDDIIVVNPHVEANPGDYVIVKNDEDEATFKQLRKYGKTTVLHPLNPRYQDIELRKGAHSYRIVGKVVKKEKKY